MQISKTTSTSSFRGIKIAPYLKKCIKESADLKLQILTQETKYFLADLGLGKEKYIDIIINKPFWHKNSDIVATISSKKQGLPINPHAEMPIPTGSSQKKLKVFLDWINSWDYSYSPEGLKKLDLLKQKAVEFLSKKK